MRERRGGRTLRVAPRELRRLRHRQKRGLRPRKILLLWYLLAFKNFVTRRCPASRRSLATASSACGGLSSLFSLRYLLRIPLLSCGVNIKLLDGPVCLESRALHGTACRQFTWQASYVHLVALHN
eukprot:6204098-Pleurochrysis_carterae.AAC.1